MSRTVEVVEYDQSWPVAYKRLRDELSSALGQRMGVMHHIGSTSVPGLAAKPIIDLLLEVQHLDAIDGQVECLTKRGFEARGEYGIGGRRYFSRPARDSLGVHLHVFAAGHPQIARHLLFRDYLRAHQEAAARYGALKLALAARHRVDRAAYQAEKADLIENIHRDAVAWRGVPQGQVSDSTARGSTTNGH